MVVGEIDGGGRTASHSTQGRTEEGRRGKRGRSEEGGRNWGVRGWMDEIRERGG